MIVGFAFDFLHNRHGSDAAARRSAAAAAERTHSQLERVWRRTPYSLQRAFPAFTVTDSDRIVQRVDENFAVSDLSGLRGL